MAEKKRKRNDDGAERPAKKTATTAKGPQTVRFECVDNTDALGPVLASTPGLKHPQNITYAPYRKAKALVPAGETPELVLHSSQHSRLDYTATEEKDGSSDSLLKDYIGVYDAATGKLQVVEVRKVTVRSTLRSEIEELREEKDRIAAAKTTMQARRHALATEFGSKKSRKAIADMTENAITQGRTQDPNAPAKDDNVASAVLQNMKSTTKAMPTKEEMAAAVDTSKPRPVANIAAEYPADVYSADSLIGSDLMSIIPVKDWVDAAESGVPVNVHSQYVAQRIFKLAKAKEIEKLKVLRFILLCINFNAALKAKGRGPKLVPFKDKLLPEMGENVPVPVVDAIRRKFASETNDMTRWHIDNLMTHIAAAALTVDNFEVDLNDLRDDLKLENKEIKQYFLEVGCRVVLPTETERTKLKISKAEAMNHNIAKLKLPLIFPKVKTGPSKKGRR